MRRLRAFLPAVVWAATVWLIGGLEVTPSAPEALGLDKVAHFTMYGVLGWLLGRGWFAERRRLPWLLPLMVALALGAADERRQQRLSARSAEVADWLADAAGAATGLFIALRQSRRSRHQ